MTASRNNGARFDAYWRDMVRHDFCAIRHQRFGDGDPRSGCDTLRAEILAHEYGQRVEADRQRRRRAENLDKLRRHWRGDDR